MKQIKIILSALTLSTIFLTSCSKDETPVAVAPASVESNGEKLNPKETCPKIGIVFETFEKEGDLDIKVIANSDLKDSNYTWTVTTPNGETFVRTDEFRKLNKELYWNPEIGTTTFEILVTTKDCPTGTKIRKTFVRTTEDVAKANAIATSPSGTSCPRVAVKILTNKDDSSLSNDIKLQASVSTGTKRTYTWEKLGLDGQFATFSGTKTPFDTYKDSPDTKTNTTFRLTVYTDECPTGVSVIKSYYKSSK